MTKSIALPAPRRKSKVSIEQALAARRSRRAFASEPVTLAEAGQLLWAAQGVTGPEGQRTAPSAGALFPLEIYLSATRVEGLAPGIYLYDPEAHRLTPHVAGDRRRELAAAADQDSMRFSACALLLAAVEERCVARHAERTGKFIAIEAGHASENVYLQAAALELSVCVVGTFSVRDVRRVMQLPAGQEPLFFLTIGRPANLRR